MIPESVDVIAALDELNRLGWNDYKIEIACGFNPSYVAQIRCGNVRMPGYPNVAKLMNFLERERGRSANETFACRGAR
jgi:hypothetical protein